ncbi:MAG: hypothetical protein HYT09_02150 [Candidatus Levybacteria bacterium]|nr:hypothetical protein [Candidatus Levybacteria bacterium]
MQFSCREYCSKKITSSQGKKHFLFSYQFNTFFPLFLVIGQLQSKQLEGGEYGFRGTKGGKVKRTITEYEEDENEL